MWMVKFSDTQAMDLSTKMKITVPQIHIVNDLIKLQTMMNEMPLGAQAKGTNKEELERLFRLMVKKRLNKEHREELGALESKDEQKALLAELFEEQLKGYQRVLKLKE